MANVLQPVGDDVWLATAPVRIVGMKLTTTMTVLRLDGGELLLHSPIPLTPALRAEVEALGRVAHLYAPNTFHHLWIADWSRAFPSARVHAPAALAKKCPELRIDRAHDVAPDPSLGLVELHVDGFRLEESVLVHRGTLVVADLVHNVGRPRDLWTVLYTRAMGFHDRVALSRVLRWTAFAARHAARHSLDTILEQPFERIVVGHGNVVTAAAHDALSSAYAWLSPTPRLLPGSASSLHGAPCG